MVKKLVVSKIMSDAEIAKCEGDHFDEKHYKVIVNEDADVYTDEGKLLLKLRKNVIPKKLTDQALKSYRSAAKVKRDNRGASAGNLDRKKLPTYVGDYINKKKFRTGFVSSFSGKTSKQMVGNLAPSNIIGYYDKIDRNLLKKGGAPCRLTAFNRDHPELWEQSTDFLKAVDQQFKKLVPSSHEKQLRQCQAVPEFAIKDTAFSTVTVNYSWRTALHKDAGDYKDGFGNLMVIEDIENPNKYKGAYTGFPQYGVAANVRTGDFLAMDVHEWHANTEFKPDREGSDQAAGGKFKKKDIDNKWHYNRLSVVCYLRDKMVRCKNLNMKLYNNKSYEPQSGGDYKIKDIKEEIYKNLPLEWIDHMNLKYGLFN